MNAVVLSHLESFAKNSAVGCQQLRNLVLPNSSRTRSKAGGFCGVDHSAQQMSRNARWTFFRDCSKSAPAAHPSGNPNAFTLLELLFVLAILATVSAVALPRVGRMLEKADHRAAADSLQAALSQLRLQAIQTGRTHSFRFVPGSGIFELSAEVIDEVGQIDFTAVDDQTDGAMDESSGEFRPERLADWAGADTLTAPLDDSGEFSIGSAGNEETIPGDLVERRQLTGQLWLVSSLKEESTTAREFTDEGYDGRINNTVSAQAGGAEDELLMEELLDDSMTVDSTASQWSAPISFFPDGRASDARLFVNAPSGYTIMLTVAGISGKVRVSNRRLLPEGASRLDLPANVPLDPALESTAGSERVDEQ